VTVSKQILSGSDDVEENKNGGMVLNSDDLELVYDTKTTGNQTVGLLFKGMNIPVGASISKAYIQFTVDERSTASCSLKIEGDDSDNAAAFGTSSYNVSGRTRTSNSVSWIPAVWKTVGASGTGQQTPDIKPIIQEIVNRPSWNPTGNLVIIITGTGTRVAESFEGSASKAPLLYIEYIGIPPAKGLTSPIQESTIVQDIAAHDVRFTVFPNPASDGIRVRLESEGSLRLIHVYNSSGTLIDKFESGSDVKETRISCSNYPAGLYFIQIETENGSGLAKVIKR
jgi:hypothetical protein